MDLKRQVKVKTGVVKRLRKELAMYEQEKVQNDKRVEDMRASGADVYDVRQAVGVVPPTPPPPPDLSSPLVSSPCSHCSFLPADPPAAPSLRRPFVSCAGAGRGRVCHDDSRLQGQVRGGDPGPPEPHGECPWPSVLNLQRTNSASVVSLRGVSAVALTPPPSFFLLLFLLLVRETGRGEGERRDQRDGGVQARARGPGGLIAAPEPIDCPDKSPSRRPCLQMSE